tara:strand:- start:87 stop:800 length:714 start_codon:yes stop_codon:yes gene_type:complete
MFHVKQNSEKDKTMADTVKTLTAKIKLMETAISALESEISQSQQPSTAYYNLMESINFSAEVQRSGDYRVTNQTEFDRRIIGEAVIDKCFYLINGKGPNTTQQGLTGRVANLTAQANRVKVSEGYDSPLFIATLAELEAATIKLDLMTELNEAARLYHNEKTPSRNGLAYCAYGEERQGNAPTNPNAGRTLSEAEIARYQKLGISVDLDEPANAKAQADRIDLEEDIRVTLDAAANH